MAVFCYHLYGFNIASDLDLPGFPTAVGPEDAHIKCLRPVNQTFQNDRFYGDLHEMTLEIGGIGLFTVKHGKLVTIEPHCDADMDLIRSYLVGMVLGVLLCQRDYLILHASCVCIQGRACLFAGHVGAGKSTFASTMLKAGGKLLADDITAIKMVDGIPLVQPGFPMMRLTPETAESTIGAGQPTMAGQIAKLGKKCYRIESGFEKKCMPLKTIYLLQYGETRKLERIPGSQTLLRCLPHLYVSFLHPAHQAYFFEKLANMLRYTKAFHFFRIRGFENLPGDCEAIARHVALN